MPSFPAAIRWTPPLRQQQETVNRQQERIYSQDNQQETNRNQRPVANASRNAASKNFTFGKNLHIGHQIIVRPHRTAAMWAKPRDRRSEERRVGKECSSL